MSLSKIITRIPGTLQLKKTINKSSSQCLYYTQRNGKQLAVFTTCSRQFVHAADPSAIRGPHLSDPENKGSHQKGINFETLGSWNNRIDMPISMEKSIEKGRLIPEIPLDEIGTASLMGRRKVNEDRFSVKKLSEDLLYFAIFDGHGGAMAVDFVHQNILHSINYWLTKTKDLSEVLQKSFVDINNLLTRHIAFYNLQESGLSTGTTATVCLLRNNIELVVGHVGDTCAILCREGEALRLTKDHHPDAYEEVERIKEAGGHISENSLGVPHVNGRLTMTRSIGDVQLKPYGVTANPQLRSIEVKHGKDSFLVLGTDGLHFVLSDQELMDISTSCSSPAEAAFRITDQALQFGSEDNTSAVVIPFGAWGKYRSTTRSIPYSFGRNLSSNRFS